MRPRGTTLRRGLIIDLRNGDIVRWLRHESDVTELFDVCCILQVQCPGRGAQGGGGNWAIKGD